MLLLKIDACCKKYLTLRDAIVYSAVDDEWSYWGSCLEKSGITHWNCHFLHHNQKVKVSEKTRKLEYQTVSQAPTCNVIWRGEKSTKCCSVINKKLFTPANCGKGRRIKPDKACCYSKLIKFRVGTVTPPRCRLFSYNSIVPSYFPPYLCNIL